MPLTALLSILPSSSGKSSYLPSYPASLNTYDRLFKACRRSLYHVAYNLFNPCQTAHKLPEAIVLNVLPDVPQRDFIAHEVSNYRSAELCCYFLIVPLPGSQACKLVIYCMAQLMKEYLDLRGCKPYFFIRRL